VRLGLLFFAAFAILVPSVLAVPPEKPRMELTTVDPPAPISRAEQATGRATLRWSCSQEELAVGPFWSFTVKWDVVSEGRRVPANSDEFMVARRTPDRCLDDQFVYWSNATIQLSWMPRLMAYRNHQAMVHANLSMFSTPPAEEKRWGPLSKPVNFTVAFQADGSIQPLAGTRLLYDDVQRCGTIFLEARARANYPLAFRVVGSGAIPVNETRANASVTSTEIDAIQAFNLRACVPLDVPKDPQGTDLVLVGFMAAQNHSETERKLGSITIHALHTEYAQPTPFAGVSLAMAMTAAAAAVWRRRSI
jgi:hypothetical protein